jgi:hypothetical protein
MNISSEGDIGDMCIMFCIVSQIPNPPHEIIIKPSSVTKFRTRKLAERLVDLMSPLAMEQDYIGGIRLAKEGEAADWESAGFRGRTWRSNETLFGNHLSHYVSVFKSGHHFNAHEKWITAEPSEATKDRIVVSRSARYRNAAFPWKRVVEKYGDRLIFVGLKEEYQEFCSTFGNLEWHKTEDMLQVAQAIKGSILFIGNQSSPNAIAEGMKHPTIQEVCLHIPDCIYYRDSAQYVYDKFMFLPGFFGDPDSAIDERDASHISTKHVPQGYWQYPGIRPSPSFNLVKTNMSQLPEFSGVPIDEVAAALKNYTMRRCPGYGQTDERFTRAKMAIETAKRKALQYV